MDDSPGWDRFSIPFAHIDRSGGAEALELAEAMELFEPYLQATSDDWEPCPFGAVECPPIEEIEVGFIRWRGAWVNDGYIPTPEEIEDLESLITAGAITLAEAQERLDDLVARRSSR